MHSFGAAPTIDFNGAKKCKDCGEMKPLAEFYVNLKSGPQACCKPCAVMRSAVRQKADPEYHRRTSREWIQRNPDKRRANNDRWKYGVPPGFREVLWVSQNGCCAICSAAITAETGNIDHDHVTGRIRGMLCWNCNKGLGAFKDSIESLTKATDYLHNTRDLRDLVVEGVAS